LILESKPDKCVKPESKSPPKDLISYKCTVEIFEYCQMKQLHNVLTVFGKNIKLGMHPSLVEYLVLIHSFNKARKLFEAIHYVTQLRFVNDLESYASIIQYLRKKNFHKEGMALSRLPTTSHSVIQALSKALELSLAITFSNDDNVIRALCRVGKVSLAVRYLTRMGFKK
ncbi:hypothetical protein Gotur_023239, partial [Gossypium turneri]